MVRTSGSLTLGDYPRAMVELACSKCQRAGRYRMATLVERHRGSTLLPDLLGVLAADCPRWTALGNDRCGAFYPDLGMDYYPILPTSLLAMRQNQSRSKHCRRARSGSPTDGAHGREGAEYHFRRLSHEDRA